MSAGNATSTALVNRLSKQEQALELRKQGHSYTIIGDRMGCNRSTAYRYVADAIATMRAECDESAADVLALELARLDADYESLAKRVDEGDPSAVAVRLRISESRRKLLGLDAPERAEVTHVDASSKWSRARAGDEAAQLEVATVLAVEVASFCGEARRVLLEALTRPMLVESVEVRDGDG